ncbi:hypothetical protein [Kozakia baliensis]|uniref:hypothetical protein n=1 Tax=Kozakia baliensis TaxID=153496 RepID=UPI000879ECBB|nr:hypothetical protein [Kozakia baliensis]AOX21514.1 hypothetical protein A0U90_13495 [Kozakia baliensis]
MSLDNVLVEGLNKGKIGDARAAISTLAWTNGLTAEPEPIDTFVEAANRLSGADAELDHHEKLLVALGRHGILSDEESMALHAAYLAQQRG